MPLDAGIVDSVTNANFKAMAEMQVTNALQHQNRMNAIFESSIGQIVNKMNVLDPTEAASVATVTEAGLAEAISQLGGAVAGIQQMLKGAQTTLPETGQGQSFGGGNPTLLYMIDTNNIRKQLLKITRKSTDKLIDKLADDVMDLCDSYDKMNSMDQLILAGEESLDHSFNMLETLRKSL